MGSVDNSAHTLREAAIVRPACLAEAHASGPESRSHDVKTIILLYAASVVYSAVRYIVFAPKNIENLPVFVVNKGVSMAAALCFAVGFLQALRQKRGTLIQVDPTTWFRAGVFGAIWHIPMSLAILRPGYFKEFFHAATEADLNPRMTFAGEMVFLFGGLTAAMVYLLIKPTLAPMTRWWLSLAAMATLLTHVLAMGYCRGLNINASHAYLPPMWLLSAIGVTVGLVWVLRGRPSGPLRVPSSSAE